MILYMQIRSPRILLRTMENSIAPDECMVSFDIVSLFTSISLGLAREAIIHILDDYDLGLPPAATIDLLDHCLSNYFQFDSRFYQ